MQYPNFTKEQLLKRLEILPKELKNAMLDDENANKLTSIFSLKDYSEEIESEIVNLVAFVFLGIIDLKDFSNLLREKTGLDELEANGIFQEIDRVIFLAFHPLLRQLPKWELEKTGSSVSEKNNFGIFNAPEIKSENSEEKQPVQEKNLKPFLSSLSSVVSGPEKEGAKQEISAPIIFGKTEEAKPILSSASPLNIAFEDVKPAKEKLVSNIEISDAPTVKKEIEKEILNPKSESEPMIKTGLLARIRAGLLNKKENPVVSESIKIVNFSDKISVVEPEKKNQSSDQSDKIESKENVKEDKNESIANQDKKEEILISAPNQKLLTSDSQDSQNEDFIKPSVQEEIKKDSFNQEEKKEESPKQNIDKDSKTVDFSQFKF